jgi:putative transposase
MRHATTIPENLPLPTSQDVLTEICRTGARQMLAQAIKAEVAVYLDARSELRDEVGRQQVVRNGHLPQRTVLTGIGAVEVEQPRVRDRRPAAERERFSSAVLPAYLRKTRSMEALIPWLYLKGVSTGDFSEALAAVVGPQAKGLSANTVTRLKAGWQQEYETWNKRSLADKHYVWEPPPMARRKSSP